MMGRKLTITAVKSIVTAKGELAVNKSRTLRKIMRSGYKVGAPRVDAGSFPLIHL